MRTHLMRHFAVALGLSVSVSCGFQDVSADPGNAYGAYPSDYGRAQNTVAQNTDSQYDSRQELPTSWNTFRRPAAPLGTSVGRQQGLNRFGANVRSVAAQNTVEDLPAPTGELLSPAGSERSAPRMPQPRTTDPRMAAPRSPSDALIAPDYGQQTAPRQQGATQHYQPQYSQPQYSQPQYSEPAQQVQPPQVPAGSYPVQSMPAPVVSQPIHSHAGGAACQSCNGGSSYQSPYASAASAPWQGGGSYSCGAPAVAAGPQPISPYFGGANLLFWNMNSVGRQEMVVADTAQSLIRHDQFDPSSEVGFDVHAGRYLGCGAYGLDFGYMFWDPSAETRTAVNTAGLRLTLPALRDVSINRGGGAAVVYDEFDTMATRIRVTRDVRVQGMEANLTSFGLMGARRLGSCSPSPLVGGQGHRGGYYGGAGGPLARASSGRCRVQTLHGFRWFQFEDDLEIIGDIDGTAGYQGSDIRYDIETENNLFGYQFGGRLAYCLGGRALFNIGGKMGVYGNNAEYRQRLGTDTVLAYTNSQGAGPGDIMTEDSDTTLAALGEFDLGLGYRLSNRWTVQGGYRVLAACGVATSIGQITTEYVSAESSGTLRADDCLIMHGAYFGFNYNW